MKPKGGWRPNSGRPPKRDEIALIERLKPLDDLAFSLLKSGMEDGDKVCLKLFMEYRYGKPQAKVDLTTGGEKLTITFKDAE
jgi:hypothetical protein